MNRWSGLLVPLLLTSVALAVFGQTTTTVPAHTHDSEDIIDGSKNPELIPDVIAWRLWMLSVIAPDPAHPELAQHRQDVFLKTAGFDDNELDKAKQVLLQFKADYESLRQAHNDQVKAGTAGNIRPQRDSLAATTRDRLLAITVHGDDIKDFLKGEKAKMRIPRSEAQQ